MVDWYSSEMHAGEVPVSDRGFQYGDGLFETIAIRNGEMRLWQYHMDRLQRGCERLDIRMPAAAELSAGVMHALRQSDVPDTYGVAKIIVSAGSSARGYGRVSAASPTVLFGVFPAFPLAVELYRDGVDTTLCETRLAVNSPIAGIKTLNRLEQVLARSEFVDSGQFEGLTMDADDNIICGTMSNVFFVTQNTLSTPPLHRCGVEGVMRRHIMATLKNHGIDTLFRNTTVDELRTVDEVFVVNSQFGLLPVRTCSDLSWPVGNTTREVMALLANNGIAECRL